MTPERESDIEVTVVTTLMFPRGQALRSLASWTAQQSLGREQIELIVATNGADPDLECAVEGTLGGEDRLLRMSTDNEMQMYDAAARQARGRWLMITEPHVIAHPDCLMTLIRHVEQNGLAGACVQTTPTVETNWVAKLESRMYLDDASTWTGEEDWRKFTKRGVMLSRRAYLEAGGLEYGYLRFAEMVLAARLRDRSLRLGYAENAVVTHYNSTELGELTDYIREYQREACAFDRDFPGVIAEVPQLPRGEVDPRAQAQQLRCAQKELGRALRELYRRSGRRRAAAMMAQIGRLARSRLLGSSGDRAAARWGYISALVRLYAARASGNEERCYEAFLGLWRRAGDVGVAEFDGAYSTSTLLSDSISTNVPGQVDLAHVPDRALLGFFAPELHNGKAFRWAAPVATLRLAIPSNDVLGSLESGLVGFDMSEARVFLNGTRAQTLPLPDRPEQVAFRLQPEMFRNEDVQYLTITSARLSGTVPGETRSLGIPVATLRFEPRTEPLSAALGRNGPGVAESPVIAGGDR